MPSPVLTDLVIAADKIIMDKPDTTRAPFSKEFCKKTMAPSIVHDGLIYPPVVQPTDNGMYRVIAGRKRTYTCIKVLGWTNLPCRVAPADLDPDAAESIELADNLMRMDLTEMQKLKNMSAWHAIYSKAHPLAQGKAGASLKQQAEVDRRVREAQSNGEVVDEARAAEIKEEVQEESKPFAKAIQETLGVSAATAGRMALVAANISQEGLEILAAHNCTKQVHEAIAALKDAKQVEMAIKLIASGLDPAEAVHTAGESGGKQSRKQKPKASKPGKQPELTDDEWLLQHCTPILGMLKRQAPFKRDAILYRRLVEALANFRKAAKLHLDRAKGDNAGRFYGSVYHVVHGSHPSEWMQCGKCEGRGYLTEGDGEQQRKSQCPKCWGAAYLMKIEG